ncbi:hypothetical protein Lesp02_00800 [Lentzea sp. NBRC 105346]|nr:hypothetical protein Lesp02_00800 [Lentzea sp. NBRC 105346]
MLEQAAHHAVVEYADGCRAPDLATARADSWRLIHPLGAISDFTAAPAACTGDRPQRHEPHSDDHAEPAQRACREAGTALSHLNAQLLPGSGPLVTWPRK